MSFALFQSYPIAYTSYGAGKNTIVLLHGFCEHQFMWADLIQHFQDEARILTIDLPGFGQSAFIPDAQIETYADAVKAVLDHEQIVTCIMAGHSMGGYVALAFAERYPEVLSGLGLLHSHPFADDEIKKQYRTKAIAMVSEYGSERYIIELFNGLFTETYKQQHPGLVIDFMQQCMQTNTQSVIQALGAMRERPDRSSVLQKINALVFFIIGASDTTITYDTGLAMSLLPQRTQLELMNHNGHMGIIEDPEFVALAIKEYLQMVK